ncbi:calcium-binding protein [Falsiroseomonas sp. HW251]|uniref:calcium-binding protein n=1 Tax=Falsiroseomonas sp. HW251 TaxID=3390998 RepID=UPI003D3134D4
MLWRNDGLTFVAPSGSGSATVIGDRTVVTGFEFYVLYGSGTGGDTLSFANAGGGSLHGLGGADSLVGGFEPDTLLGGDQDDAMDGGSGGNDYMAGGAGNDVYVWRGDGTADSFVEAANEGFDEVRTTVSTTWRDGWTNIERLVLLGGNGSATGSGGNDELVGADGAQTLDGGSGNDTVSGLGGDDVLFGSNGADSLSGGTGNDEMEGGASNDTLEGAIGNDTLEGTARIR